MTEGGGSENKHPVELLHPDTLAVETLAPFHSDILKPSILAQQCGHSSPQPGSPQFY